jgi:two-component sensor histidine kinase
MRLRWLIALLLGVSLISGGFFAYAEWLSRQLLQQQRQLVRLYAEAIGYMATAPEETIPPFFWNYFLPDPKTGKHLTLPPMVVVDPAGRLLMHNLDEAYHIPKSRIKDLPTAMAILKPDTVAFPPLDIQAAPALPRMRIYYGEPLVLRRLRWMPIFSALMVALIGLGWVIAVYAIARYRQNRLWVGLTREAAHQIGTPLSGLMGAIELLRENPHDAPTILPMLEKDVERIQEVVDRFSKIGAPPQLAPAPLQPLLQSVVAYFQARIPQNIHLHLEMPETPVVIPHNSTTLRWVLENLIRNALDAMPKEGGHIRLSLVDQPHEAIIRVQDTGKGIPPSQWEAIFRPGFTTKRSGWGIGLTLARRIVEEYHHGLIFVRRSGPQGTTFEIRLPKKQGGPFEWLRKLWRQEVLRRWLKLRRIQLAPKQAKAAAPA